MTSQFEIRVGHCLELLAEVPDESVDCCVTSPPYWGLRDYGDPGRAWPEVSYRPLPGMPEIVVPAGVAALGQEREPYHYVAHLVAVFREVRRVLKSTGTLWLNLGDSFVGPGGGRQGKNGQRADRSFTPRLKDKDAEGLKSKDLACIPWLVALALRTDGWYLRSDIVWSKPNPMPESVRDRPTRAHEYVFSLAKSERYFYDHVAVREDEAETSRSRYRYAASDGRINSSGAYREAFDGTASHGLEGRARTGNPVVPTDGKRNKRSVWTQTTQPYKGAHFAVMPRDLVRPCILAGCPPGGLVLDPFAGAGTTGLVAVTEGRCFLGLEQSAEYAALARERIAAGEKPRRIATSSPRTSPRPATSASAPEQLVLPLTG